MPPEKKSNKEICVKSKARNKKVLKADNLFSALKYMLDVIFTKQENKIILENVLFITGYSYLTRLSKKTLDDVAETLKKETFSFVVQGHVCCTEGSLDAVDRKTNKRNLSIARAKYVYDYLLKKGI